MREMPPVPVIPRERLLGTAVVRPHPGLLRRAGLRWQSEIGVNALFLFEPGYNPVRLHFTKRAAERRRGRYLRRQQERS